MNYRPSTDTDCPMILETDENENYHSDTADEMTDANYEVDQNGQNPNNIDYESLWKLTEAISIERKPLHADQRRVSFADSVGQTLAHIKIMTEGLNTPPKLDFCRLHLPHHELYPTQLSPKFEQPVSEFNSFMDLLRANNVILESASVARNRITGMVKVRNIAYEKNVFVRYSVNKWTSSHDVACYYINPMVQGASNAVYDTFSFELDTRPSWKELSLCVAFECQGQRYWDNNRGQNYNFGF